MGFEKGGKGGPGGLFHWVTATDTGIRVTDVWQDRQAFEKFADEKIGPITAEVGLPGQPNISFYPVHNYLTAGWARPLASGPSHSPWNSSGVGSRQLWGSQQR